MPIVDQFKEIMQIHRQSQYSQFLLTFCFWFPIYYVFVSTLCNCNTYEERDSSIT